MNFVLDKFNKFQKAFRRFSYTDFYIVGVMVLAFIAWVTKSSVAGMERIAGRHSKSALPDSEKRAMILPLSPNFKDFEQEWVT